MNSSDGSGDNELLRENPPKNTTFLIILTITAAIGGFLFGYDTGIIGGANLYIYDDLGYKTPVVLETVVSLAVIGAMFGALAAGPLSDIKGRKPTIIAADCAFVTGSILMASAPNIWVLMLGRFIVGLGVGSAAMVVPIYLAESAPRELRGTIVSINVLFTTSGQLIAYCVCLSLEDHWRWMLGIGAIPAIIQVIGMFFLPESPRFLYKVGKLEQGLKALLHIRYSLLYRKYEYIEEEVKGIMQSIKEEGNHSYKHQFKLLYKNCKRSAMVGIGLQCLQQLCGINTAMYYGPQIMQVAGFDSSGREAIIASIPIAFANMVGTFISVWYVDRLGRRSTLLYTIPFMVTFLLSLGASFVFITFFSVVEFIQYLAVFSLLVYILFFSVGMGTCPWIVNSEIYPLNLRSAATSASTTANWVSNFVVSMTFASAISFDAGRVGIWIILAGFGVISWFWVYKLLPETKGKSLEEILTIFQTGKELD
ncbi:unnamed protein product [Blepharisma stoltei]|uniref:Hexose transporter 1 n=1 Tax=Blepharisma stoltei TaxID=1481888 RepID=A0AAU9IXP8_9CILI|nr:unnamed protein product [Blepharisma stoltei]